ncbi:MAG: ATP-dependent DNA helicase RecG [Dehalococcoidia bacterium]
MTSPAVRNEAEERLLRVLKQEERRGFDDRAVMGGLDRLLKNFVGRLGPQSALLRAILDLPPMGYAALTPPQRRHWAERVQNPPAAAKEVAAGRKQPRPRPATGVPAAIHAVGGLSTPISRLSIRETTAQKIAKIKRGVGPLASVYDLLTHYPFRHIDYGRLAKVATLQPGDRATLARVASVDAPFRGNRGRPVRAVLTDDYGRIEAVWFNQSWVAAQLKRDQWFVFAGKVGYFNGRLQFENPEYEPANEETREYIDRGRLVPVYPSTAGLPQRTLRRAVGLALKGYLQLVPELLPAEIRHEAALLEQQEAIQSYHYPQSLDEYTEAEKRLGFDEFFIKQMVVLARRRAWQSGAPAPNLSLAPEILERFTTSLPFSLTGAQERALAAILRDLRGPAPMSRLLQGDVGSGKTVVATAAIVAALANSHQAVVMAPTEILAEQHYQTISRLLGAPETAGALTTAGNDYLDRPVTIAHLTGGQKGSTKKEVRAAIAAGEVDVAIGTHALVEESVDFARLGLAVVDEQHRFGVVQRDRLKKKGESPHLLVMTATPIPRTLSLTVYGDLDNSIIDELPPGRQRIETRYVAPYDRPWAYTFLREQVQAGRQAFVICPLVEESETIEAKAAVQEYQRLSTEIFPDLRLALLHGRMKPAEKDRVMTEFRAADADILVSTSVIEVGIDIPNATVMLIEGADRFGLAQLHQFRGRVGRGSEQSFCLLLSDDPSDEAKERLDVVVSTNDGFKLAEEDLRIRGAGEYYGVRQSGLADFRVAQLSDEGLLATARQIADRVLTENPQLEGEEYAELKHQVTDFAASRNIILAFH